MNKKTNIPPIEVEIADNILYLKGSLTIENADATVKEVLKQTKPKIDTKLDIHLGELNHLDSIGVASLGYIKEKLAGQQVDVRFTETNEKISEKLKIFAVSDNLHVAEESKGSFFEILGESAQSFVKDNIFRFVTLMANVVFWSFTDIFKSKMQRKGEFYNQAVLIGVNAIWIVGAMAFIIGLVLALQSASQLRNFGANIYIVDLTVIAMMSEMGPLITAILVAGRSGSSIAAEVATMKVTSELDALKTMAINPVRYVVVPKMHGSIVTLPFLTIVADIMGILGGMLIAFVYLDITPQVFINRMADTLYNRDILIGIFKSLVFASIIVLTGSFMGLKVKEGAEGVGKVTTMAVVVSIALVIIADSIMSLIFY